MTSRLSASVGFLFAPRSFQTAPKLRKLGLVAVAYATLALVPLPIFGGGPAHAANCTVMAHNQFGDYINGTHAKVHALKRSTACKRAERRCNRRLERKIRNGNLSHSPRGAKCRIIANL
jgi:hypothetical protein